MAKAQDIIAFNSDKSQQIFTSIDEISNESLGTIVLSSEPERIGQIVAMNSSACRIFCYSRPEIVGRKIENLMPILLAERHDSFLNNFLVKKESIYMKRERPIFAKNKNQYIFPAYIRIRTMQTASENGLHFIGTFRVEKMFRKTCFILTDTTGNIVNISSTCINFFFMDNSWIAN